MQGATGSGEEEIIQAYFGCEMYVARRRLFNKEGNRIKAVITWWCLPRMKKAIIILSKLVSEGMDGRDFMRPRTDRVELEKYHEGSDCLYGVYCR